MLKQSSIFNLKSNIFKIIFKFINVFPDFQSLPASLDLFRTMPYFGWTGIWLLFGSFCSLRTLISCFFHLKHDVVGV